MGDRMAALYSLLEKGKRLMSAPDAQQVIAVKTAKANVYHFASRCVSRPEDEEAFLKMLCDRNDAELQYLVCVWDNIKSTSRRSVSGAG